MRNEKIASLLVVVILASAAAGYIMGINLVAVGSTVTTTVTGSLSTLGANESCALPMGNSGGILLQITNRSIPVANATITVEVIGRCNGSAPVVLTVYDVATDSTGWASMCVDYNGICSFAINLADHQYPLSVPLLPGGGSIVHYDLWNNSETVTPVAGTTTTTTTTSCTISAEGFLLMKVLNSSNNEPIGSIPVHVEVQYPACPPNPPHTDNLGSFNTNASGFLNLGGTYNWFYISIDHGNEIYSINATINAGTLTCVTLPIPSGNPNIAQGCDPARYFAPSIESSNPSP
jgi:hypothetical protein